MPLLFFSFSYNYDIFYPLVNNFWSAHHATVTLQQQRVEDKALLLIRNGSKDEAVALLRTFTSNQAQDALKHAQYLLELKKPVREGTVVEQHTTATHQ